MEEKLRPIIENDVIININEVLEAIKECYDYEILKDYEKEVKEIMQIRNIINLPELAASLSLHLESLTKDNVLPKTEVEIISETKANQLIVKLYDRINLTNEEKNQFHKFITLGLKQMEDTTIHYDAQNIIDMYIEYLGIKELEGNLTIEETQIISRYKHIIEEKEKQLGKDESLKTGEIRKLKFLPSNLNTNGAVVTVVILEVTILLGILISVIALAKR